MENTTSENLIYLEVAAALTGISGFLSVLSSLALMYTFFFILKMEKGYTKRLLLFLSLSDLIYSFGIVLGAIRYFFESLWYIDTYCQIQAFFITWFGISSFVWTFIIAIHACLVQVKNSALMEIERNKIICHAVAWNIPLMIAIAALASQALGEEKSKFSHTWCWINDSQSAISQIIWILIAGKGWEVLTYIGTSVILILGLIDHMRQQRKKEELNRSSHDFGERTVLKDRSEKTKDDFAYKHNMMVWVGLYLYLPRIWGTIRYSVQIARLATGNQYEKFIGVDKYLFFLHCFGDSCQAIVNFLMFCLHDKEMRQKLCCWCCRSRDDIHKVPSEQEVADNRDPINSQTCNKRTPQSNGQLSINDI